MGGARDDRGLRALRRLRALEEKQARRALAEAIAATTEARAAVDVRRADHAAAIDRERAARDGASSGTSISDLLTARRWADRLAAETAAAAAALAAAEQTLTTTRAAEATARAHLATAIRARKLGDGA